MQFSQKFKLLCKAKGVSQQKALADMGFNRNAVQSWSENDPLTEAVVKVALYFQVSSDYLLGLSDDPNGTTFPPEVVEMFRKIQALDPATKKVIDKLL